MTSREPSAVSRAPTAGRVSPELGRLTYAMLLSLLLHALLLSMMFGDEGHGLPGFSFPWQDRRIEVPDLSVVVVPPATSRRRSPWSRPMRNRCSRHQSSGRLSSGPTHAPPVTRSTTSQVTSDVIPRQKPIRRRRTIQVQASQPVPLLRKRAVASRSAWGHRAAAHPRAVRDRLGTDRRVPRGSSRPPPTKPTSVIAVVPSAESAESAVPSLREAGDAARARTEKEAQAENARLGGPNARSPHATWWNSKRCPDKLRCGRPPAVLEAAQLEAEERQEAVRQEAARAAQTDLQNAAQQVATRQETANLEAERQESTRVEAAKSRNCTRRSGKGRSSKGRSGKGRSRKSRSSKGRSRKGRSSKGRSGKGRSRKSRSSKGRSRKGRSGKGRSRKGRSGKGRSRKGRSRKGRSRKDRSRKNRSGRGPKRQKWLLQMPKWQRPKPQRWQLQTLKRQKPMLQRWQVQMLKLQRPMQHARKPPGFRLHNSRPSAGGCRKTRSDASGNRTTVGRGGSLHERARAAARPNPSSSGVRRYRLFGRTDPNAEIVLYAETWSRKIEMSMTLEMGREEAKQPHTDPSLPLPFAAMARWSR